ncbi:ATP-binding protein [Streptomyces sp. NPDC048361]|uniref:ATP-binding protein n=1 Tax=Streptomyces sp. NPDC048361 TaxID=3154720 RepID=UPI00341B0D83
MMAVLEADLVTEDEREDASEQAGRSIHAAAALDGDGPCIAQARQVASGFLTLAQAEHGVLISQRGMDLTRLVVSELVTNAVKYAPGPVLLDLSIQDETVRISVWDSDPVLPIARAADAGRVGQHGLEIVMSVAEGFEAHRERVGKRITARIALHDAAGHANPA